MLNMLSILIIYDNVGTLLNENYFLKRTSDDTSLCLNVIIKNRVTDSRVIFVEILVYAVYRSRKCNQKNIQLYVYC